MSAELATGRPLTSLPLTAQLAEIFGALFPSCRGAFTAISGRGSASVRYWVPATWRKTEHTLLPNVLVRELAADPVDELRVTLSTRANTWGAQLLDVPALWAEIPLRGTGPVNKGPSYEELSGSAADKLATFSLPLSILVDAGWSLLALWLLKTPIRVDEPQSRSRVEAVQRALAEALGGRLEDVKETLPTRSVGRPALWETVAGWSPERMVFPVPGSMVKAHEARRSVVLARADLAARYNIEDIEAALGCGPMERKERKR